MSDAPAAGTTGAAAAGAGTDAAANQPGANEPGANQQVGNEPGGAENTPPWGSDADFDPAKAWSLIENLRADKSKLTPEVEQLRTKVKAFEDAQLTDAQKAARDAEETQTQIGTLSAQNALLKAVIAHPQLTADDIELLDGLPADAIEQRAAKLAARLGSAAPQNTLTNRPGERPRGGSDPSNNPTPGRDWLREALSKTD